MPGYINRGVRTEEFIVEICTKLNHDETVVLSGWPFETISLANVQDILSAYHEIGLHQAITDDKPEQQWYLAGNIVARIQRDRKEYEKAAN